MTDIPREWIEAVTQIADTRGLYDFHVPDAVSIIKLLRPLIEAETRERCAVENVYILRVLGIMSKHDCTDDLWWRTDGVFAPVTFFINCNDLFFWGCSDAEPITPETVDVLAQSFADAEAAGDESHGGLLYCARRREMRPQGACYKYYEPPFAALMDACGPKRETGIGNPRDNVPKSPTPERIASALRAEGK